MILASILNSGKNISCIVLDNELYPFPEINSKFSCNWSINLLDILKNGELGEIEEWLLDNKSKLISFKEIALKKPEIVFSPLYKNPGKIWGIGLNYKDHAEDLSEQAPTEIPASFMKPATTIIGHMDQIKIPKMSKKTTGEAELGIIIGKECKNIERKNWLDYVAGYTTIIDMTAEDILRKNPRYLTVSKSFDTFFSFGPYFYTKDEISDINTLKVATVINGKIWAENAISNMTFPLDFLVAFHSEVMTLLPGDIISTGTPKATPLSHNDVIECNITGFEPLKNPVIDLKIKYND